MHTHTLLLVDDSSTTEQELRSALAGEPIEIIVAANGHAALDRIEDHRPNVVLASTTAPGVDGYGLAKYVSQRSYLSNVAVLLLTADVTPSDTYRMKASGARGFVSRPLEPGTVRANVKEVLIFPGPELREVDVLAQLTPAFDVIDESMTDSVAAARVQTSDHPITPEVLERIVADAVRHAIAAYEHARRGAPAATPESAIANERRAPVPSARAAADAGLAAQMGMDEFTVGEVVTSRVQQTTAPDSESDFAFGIDDLPPIDALPRPNAAPRPYAAPAATLIDADQRIGPSAGSALGALQALRHAATSLGTAVAEGAGRLRSALAARAKQRREPPHESRED